MIDTSILNGPVIVPKNYFENRIYRKQKGPGLLFSILFLFVVKALLFFFFFFFKWEKSSLEAHSLSVFYREFVPALKVNYLNQIINRKVIVKDGGKSQSTNQGRGWSLLQRVLLEASSVFVQALNPQAETSIYLPRLKLSILWNCWEDE